MSKFLDNTGLSHLIGKIKTAFVAKADTTTVQGVDVDSTPTQNSIHLVTSGGVAGYVDSATLNEQKKMDIVAASGTTLSADVNTYYNFASEVNTLAVTLPSVTDSTHINNIVFMLTTGSTPAVTFAASGSGVGVIAKVDSLLQQVRLMKSMLFTMALIGFLQQWNLLQLIFNLQMNSYVTEKKNDGEE